VGKDQRNSVSSGDAGAKTSSIEASASPGSFKRMTAARKQSNHSIATACQILPFDLRHVLNDVVNDVS